MASAQAILDDIDLRYRNTFTTANKLVWFNEEQRELFDVLELDSAPYNFTTVADENFYAFPDQFDVSKIKVVTFQNDDTDDPTYIEIPFKRNDDNQYGSSDVWYTIASDAMYLYVPDTVPADRNVYIYCDADPAEVTTANLSSSPECPVKFQELLKLGVLKRIAAARKDGLMKSNYEADYDQKIADVMWARRLAEPEFVQPANSNFQPIRGYGWTKDSYVPTGL